MKPRTFVPGIVAACATAFLSAGLLAQQTPGEKKQPQAPAPKSAKPDYPATPKPAAQPSPEEAAFMEAWAKYATPGAQHAQLAKKTGKWTVNGKMWMAPGSVPQEFGGTSTLEMDLDGHYLVENVVGSEPDPITGQVFKGRAWIAFDNLTNKIVTVWIDNMGTGITRFTGTANADWTTITLTGESPDFITGKYKTVKSIERKISDSQYVVTMLDKGPDGKEYTSMELTYNRAGGAAPTARPTAPAKRP